MEDYFLPVKSETPDLHAIGGRKVIARQHRSMWPNPDPGEGRCGSCTLPECCGGFGQASCL
ncbi:MAG: hypothetical protein KO206_02495 [Methanomicrobiaceae archaeon]|uniref:Uncharacterized protein n=1 Tax=hydrocarbon metagenome TaxID=938273 RepID=A0A0W8FI26_9ZZZZ|nr:hypothetical protein [Methanomicrobiaceae archaeon]